VIAHVAGIPVEETILHLVPVGGVAVMAWVHTARARIAARVRRGR
jgi:hypothetical protein